MAAKLLTPRESLAPILSSEPPRPASLGIATPRGVGQRPRMSPAAAAAFATFVDPARARAAMEGRTLVYTVRWS
ncbi:MAG TPA: hypothetical protein VGV89_05520 [Thermoplasmata archaeon]|nr:hypothetical protein [Thermoplasmata archaeon]